MLHSIDILVGLSVVMLVVSMAVTLLTQLVIGAVNMPGGHLMRGLSDLLQQLDPTLTAQISKQISKSVLTSPLISDVGGRLGTVIHREEFIKVLMDLASQNGPQKLKGDALTVLKTAMANNGIADPEAALNNIRAFMLTLEQSNPELANNVRLNAAIMHEAESQFVAKIHGWFDQTIDRVGGRFTASARLVTIAVSLVVAFGMQLDSLALINRLDTDASFRQSLVENAQAVDSAQAPVTPQTGVQTPVPAQNQSGGNPNAAAGSPAAAGATPTAPSVPGRVSTDVDAILSSAGLIAGPDWSWQSFKEPKKDLGILLSALLLSMGAPFWYDLLKTSLRLRSAIADKDDAQRLERQTTQAQAQPPPVTEAGLVATGFTVAGERGDLGLIGQP